jgi:glucose-1-phosphate cytidylyltransferase
MKVVILAGGLGTRLSELTHAIAKPMVNIGGKPILMHIMQWYASFGHTDFIIALGYKGETIKEFFLKYKELNSNLKIDLATGVVTALDSTYNNWTVTLIDTGESTMTGGRIKRLKNYIGDDTFMITYGDGLSNVNLSALLDFHKKNKKLITVTAVHPAARFGELELRPDGLVKQFKEKPQMKEGWINGGFFVVEPQFLEYIDNDHEMLEREPLEKAVASEELIAYVHNGYWQCMDTKRDHELLESLWASGDAPWKASSN